MIRTSRKTVVSSVRAEILKYGKLVLAEGRVHPSAEYAVTGRSRGFPPHPSLLPSKLFERALETTQLDPKARETGGLFVRSVDLQSEGAWIALMRVRFRPEGGEGSASRPYLQATTWLVRCNDWHSGPAAVLEYASANLRAKPDLASEPSSKRFALAAEEINVDRSPRFTWEDFRKLGEAGDKGDEDDRHECDAVARVVQVMLSENGHGSQPVFGTDLFPSEAEYLRAVGKAFDLVEESPRPIPKFHIASGLRVVGPGLPLRYLPSAEKTTAPLADWQKVLADLAPVPMLTRVREARHTDRFASKAIPKLPPDSGASSPRIRAYPPDQHPVGQLYPVNWADDLVYESEPGALVHEQQQLIKETFVSDSAAADTESGAFDKWRERFERYLRTDDAQDAYQLICVSLEAYDKCSDRFRPSVDLATPKHAFWLAMTLCGRSSRFYDFSLQELLSYAHAAKQAFDWSRAEPGALTKRIAGTFVVDNVKAIAQRIGELKILWPEEYASLERAKFWELANIADREEGLDLSHQAREVERYSRIFREATRNSTLTGFYRCETDPAQRKLLAEACDKLSSRAQNAHSDPLYVPPARYGVPGLDKLNELDRQHPPDLRKSQQYEDMLTEIAHFFRESRLSER